MTSGVLALTKFEVKPDGDRDGTFVSITCRRRGLRALIRTALGLDVNMSLNVKRDAVHFKDLSLFEEHWRTIPITAVRAVDAGLRRPVWKLVWGVLFLALSVASRGRQRQSLPPQLIGILLTEGERGGTLCLCLPSQ